MFDNLPIDSQFIIFLVIAVAGFIRSTFFKKKEEEHEEEYESAPRPAHPQEDPMTEFRRMIEEAKREAQEQQQAPQPAPTPSEQSQQPPRVAKPEAPQPTTPPPVASFQPPVINAPAPKASSFPSSKKKVTRNTSAGSDLSLKALLKSPSAAKQAIILKEVLGKPKGLR